METRDSSVFRYFTLIYVSMFRILAVIFTVYASDFFSSLYTRFSLFACAGLDSTWPSRYYIILPFIQKKKEKRNKSWVTSWTKALLKQFINWLIFALVNTLRSKETMAIEDWNQKWFHFHQPSILTGQHIFEDLGCKSIYFFVSVLKLIFFFSFDIPNPRKWKRTLLFCFILGHMTDMVSRAKEYLASCQEGDCRSFKLLGKGI